LVFIKQAYHDARSRECEISFCHFAMNTQKFSHWHTEVNGASKDG